MKSFSFQHSEDVFNADDSHFIWRANHKFPSTPFDWYNFISQDINSNALIQVVLRFPESLNYRILRQAYVCCIFNDPILSARFCESDIPFWKMGEVDLDFACQEVFSENNTVRNSENNTERSSENNTEYASEYDDLLIKKFLAEPLDVRSMCPARLCLINGNILVIKLHHALCDGASAVQYVKMLSQNYSFLCQRGPDFLSMCAEKPLLRDFCEFYKYFGVPNDKAAKESRLDTSLLGEMTSSWGAPVGDAEAPQEFDFQTLQLSAAEIESLKAFATANGSSLNAVLTAAYHRALVQMLHHPAEKGPASAEKVPDSAKKVPNSAEKVPDSAEIQFTADLRRFSPQNTDYSLSNFSNVFNIQLPTGGNFASLVRETSRATSEALEPERVLQTVLASELMSTNYSEMKAFFQQDWGNVKASGLCTPMISNLGLLSSEPIVFGVCAPAQMFVVSPAFTAPAFMLSVSTYGGIMTLCASYRTPSLSHSFVRELLDRLKKCFKTL